MKYIIILLALVSCQSNKDIQQKRYEFIYGEYIKRGDELYKLKNDSFALKAQLEELRADSMWLSIGHFRMRVPNDNHYEVRWANGDTIMLIKH
jgi:hypothetical protein